MSNYQDEEHRAVKAASSNSDASPSVSPRRDPPSDTVDRHTPMHAILGVVALAIVLFLAFSVYSIYSADRGKTQLAQIKTLYFPVLERIDIGVVQLDKMEEQYMLAVMTGEREPLEVAAERHSQADAALAEVVKLYPARAAEADALVTRLRGYKEQANATAQAILDKTAADVSGSAVAMSKSLATLRHDIKAFRQSSYDEFVAALESTQRVARQNIFLGIAAGVLNLGFMAVLVFFIRNNVRMMAVIAEQNATLERRVDERTAQLTQKTNDIAAMLQNMSLGVCTVVPGNRIHAEYSAHLRLLTGVADLAGQPLLPAVFGSSDQGENSLDQIGTALSAIVGEDRMMFEFNSHLLPTEMQMQREGETQPRIVQMHWSPIVGSGNTVEKVLLILQDVTHLRALELEATAQRAFMDTIGRILKVPVGRFNEFMNSASDMLADCRARIAATVQRDDDVVAHLFRNMHTIKGNARSFEFVGITDVAHAAEQRYDHLRKNAGAKWDASQLLADLQAVEEELANYRRVNDETLGRKGRAGDLVNGRGVFLRMDEVAAIKAAVTDLIGQATEAKVDRLRGLIDGVGMVSLERLASGVMDSAGSLAAELRKTVPTLSLTGGDISFNPNFAEALKGSLMHMLRNALDHGIETPDVRLLAGKDPRGLISIEGTRRDKGVELRIRDDGQGMPLHLLLQRGRQALTRGDVADTRREIAELIFKAGVSTAAEVTQVSGRGVGMDAVRNFLRAQGAEIRVELDNDTGPIGYAPFSFVIDVPDSACRI